MDEIGRRDHIMRVFPFRLSFLICLVAFIAPTLSARQAWIVLSKGNLDDRLTSELEDLARENHAAIRFLPASPKLIPTHATPGKLAIEPERAESLDAFLDTLKQQGGHAANDARLELAKEGYLITAESEASSSPHLITIKAASARGFHYALLRLPQLLRARRANLDEILAPPPRSGLISEVGRASEISVTDFPSFPERGIVEGFYGKPWSHSDRLAMLRFEGRHGMNVYIYAPKDDPYHRKLWREPYPPAEMKQLGELVAAARANFVDFYFAISPGLSMTYSSDQDFADLTAKLDGVAKLGVDHFALFLDDVPQELQNPADQARYKTLAAAHVDLINKLYHYLQSQSTGNRLVVTPTVYTSEWGSRDYARELGSGVIREVPIIWTGSKVVSPAITVAQAQEWGTLLRRPPLIWDNFPVNDGISWRVNLGPLRGRDPNLPSAVRGLVANPMVEPRASMIPLQTIAEYLWNASAYKPEAAERRAVEDQYGKDALKKLSPFLATYGDYWWDENIFKPLFVEERRAIDIAAIRQRISRLESAARALRKNPRFRTLMDEIAPLLPRTRERLSRVVSDPAFRQGPRNQLIWRDDYDVLRAIRQVRAPALDGDFAKWEGGPVYTLNQPDQISAGAKLWRGAGQFSARFALGWDDQYLYIGADVTDSALYQPFSGRDISKGDVVSLVLETAFRENFQSTSFTGDEYSLLFSPGDFGEVKPSVHSEEDYLLPPIPPRHEYGQEIKMAWKKTAGGFSGDIAIPAAWFNGGRLQVGYEIGLSLGAQKVIPGPPPGPAAEEEVSRIVFRSKSDRLFPVRVGNPSTEQRLLLVQYR